MGCGRQEYLDFVAGVAVIFSVTVIRALSLRYETGSAADPCFELLPYRTADKACKIACRAFFADKAFSAIQELRRMRLRLACEKYARRMAPRPVEIITAENSFHGRTFAALTATGQKSFWGFEPRPGFRYVPFNDIHALKRITKKTCAVLLEPIQGEGGENSGQGVSQRGERTLQRTCPAPYSG
jgi:adenosylmethionine-8-amino-7-oxononanoate aminotransferase